MSADRCAKCAKPRHRDSHLCVKHLHEWLRKIGAIVPRAT
jgi:hypothetical protein